MFAGAITIKPSQAESAVALALTAKEPIMLWGPPGVGKSGVFKTVAQREGVPVVDMRMVIRDSVDLHGVPFVEGGLTRWAAPAELPQEGRDGKRGILLLDELAQAPIPVQNAALSLLWDRFIGEYKLPDGWVVMAASNRVEDRAGAGKTTTTINNRMTHYEVTPDLSDWCVWALRNQVRIEVVSFLRFRPEFLHKFDAKSTERAFPSPRSWERVSRLIAVGMDRELEMPTISGTVGKEAAAEFSGSLRIFRSLPALDTILSNPGTAPIPEEPSARYAVCTGLARRLDSNNVGQIVVYGRRLPNEFQALMVRDMERRDAHLMNNTAAAVAWKADLKL
jgi:hypothetical protein